MQSSRKEGKKNVSYRSFCSDTLLDDHHRASFLGRPPFCEPRLQQGLAFVLTLMNGGWWVYDDLVVWYTPLLMVYK